jgi:hypothetical protein
MNWITVPVAEKIRKTKGIELSIEWSRIIRTFNLRRFNRTRSQKKKGRKIKT